MFSKLLKYDLRDIAKSIGLIYIIILLSGVFVRLFEVLSNQLNIFGYIKTGSTIILVISSIVGLIYCFFVGIKNFYQKVLKDEGYLTNTLPVKKYKIILSKGISLHIMLIVTVFIILLSVLIGFYEKGMLEGIWDFANTIVAPTGYDLMVIITLFGTSFILSSITLVSSIYCALAIGHKFSQNKLGYSIIAGIVLYFIFQILNVIGIVVIFLANPDILELLQQNIPPENILFQMLGISFTNMVILTIATYLITNYHLKNRLNLE